MAAIGAGRFAPQDAGDRVAMPAFVALVWFGILMGFVPEVAGKLEKGELTYPLAVHIHAAVFVGWLVLLTTQVSLVRTANVALHRRLGVAGAWLAGLVVIMGLVVSYVMDHLQFGTPQGDAPFLAIQLFDMINFAGLAGAALLLRRDAAAHKRLMLLAVFAIVDAGYSRWWGPGLEASLGKTFFGEWMAYFLGNILLIGGLGLYDLATRRRLHPAYAIAAPIEMGLQAMAVWFYISPWWAPVATRLIGH